MELVKYKDWRPTQFDGYIELDGEQDTWYVCPVIQTRDSGPLEESNFATMERILVEANATYQTHRFGHWGPGWFEIILTPRADIVEETTRALEYYPVLDETDWSEREYEAVQEYWESMSINERIDRCRKEGESIFAARRDCPPDRVFDSLRDNL